MLKKDLIIKGPKNAKIKIILAHGAGAMMDSDWMNELTTYLVKQDIQVIRFEFPYMNERRVSGKKRPPNTKKVLLETWREVFALVGDKNTYIGGKSMGGRMATLIADELKPKGVICLGFPFHAPGKDPKDRIDHLKEIKTKVLILQGTRDSMGTREDVEGYTLSKKIKVEWFEDGDHGLKPRVRTTGCTLSEYLLLASEKINKYCK
ncbi:alpha/beta hydrolase [Halobacteriovorax marinus]|uniref:Alpha/beta hydrolase n=1 Tax=Halobacteriovorax marinus TaxID=97084 RepID=A0A1Y5FCE7_9BACT|nr:alpha/beta hydrolase [Halobacteriovorax marinus]